MPAPATYTEASLLDLMLDELGATGAALGFVVDDTPLVRAVAAVERALGVADVASVTDMALLESAARWQAWLAAEAAAISKYTVTLGGGKKFERGKIFDDVQVRLARAYSAYLIEKARVDAASGSGAFYFGTVAGCRGR
jgi:hypothetical protein